MTQQAVEKEVRARRGPERVEAGARGSVVVPLDGTKEALSALPVARQLARLRRASLDILHVGAPVLSPQALLRELKLTPEDAGGAVIEQVIGVPAEAIARHVRVRGSSLLVMRAHTRRDVPEPELGTVTAGVLRGAPCPIVLVPPGWDARSWAFERVVILHDGTPSMAEALSLAASLAVAAGAEMTVVHVCALGVGKADKVVFTVPEYFDQPYHEWASWEQRLLDWMGSLGDWPPSLKADISVTHGAREAEALGLAAETGAGLLVLACEDYCRSEGVAALSEVVRRARCPVLVCATRGPARRATPLLDTDSGCA